MKAREGKGNGVLVITVGVPGRSVPAPAESRSPRRQAAEAGEPNPRQAMPPPTAEPTESAPPVEVAPPAVAKDSSQRHDEPGPEWWDLTMYTALAPYCATQHAAETLKYRMYMSAIDQWGKDRNQVAFTRAFDEATDLYRRTMQQAEEVLREAIRHEVPMTANQAAKFWATHAGATKLAG
jgi:hypothetical protein